MPLTEIDRQPWRRSGPRGKVRNWGLNLCSVIGSNTSSIWDGVGTVLP